jgi:NAD+-dependent protein deacetylase SIR2
MMSQPDITFFGEGLPNRFFRRLKQEDRYKVDLVVVIGTSMKVAPVSEIPNFIESHVPCIYISREVSLTGLYDCHHLMTLTEYHSQ